MDNLSGQSIKGYNLIEQIGEGGFGVVYRARQPVIEREVAIKIILPQHANQAEFIRRFEAEAQLVARLEHPHIVPLYDYWRDPQGAYLVMRLLRGGSLKEAMERGRWSLSAVTRFLSQMAAALTVAHEHGVVHRDIKPANIFLDEQENAYLGDFGIAKNLRAEAESSDDKLMLSPAYVAPEQVNIDGDITPQADIYALGLLLYELLCGLHPFNERRTPIAMLRAHLYDPLPSLQSRRPDLPIALDAVLLKATAKTPSERYSDAFALEEAFRAALGSGSPTPVVDVVTRTSPIDLVETFPELDAPLVPLTPRPAPENPFRGLRAFQGADAGFFFGREALTMQLVKRLSSSDEQLNTDEIPTTQRFLAVVGPSGCGKSSVVRAGLIPALRAGAVAGSENWFYLEMLPSEHPFEELEAALLSIAQNPPTSLMEQLKADVRGFVRAIKRVLPRDAEGDLLLFIDQFEEVFTLVQDPVERTLFINSLYEAASDPRSRLRIVITLRSDFYDRPLMIPRFGDLMRACTAVVLPLTPEELERSISAPLSRVGVKIEVGAVAAIIAAVGAEPGALPLMQYALTELFDGREGDTITLAQYQAIGGVSGALARRADTLYAGLDADGQTAAAALFLRLVTLGEGAQDTRRRVVLEELLSLGLDKVVMQTVLNSFGKHRLLTFDRDPASRAATVEVAHEAIIAEWGQLRAWLDENREHIRLQRQLGALAREWNAAEHEASFLIRGARLEEMQRWALGEAVALTDDERAFLAASQAAYDAAAQAEAERQAREVALERRAKGRLRGLVVILTLAALVASGLAYFAFLQRNEARSESEIAATERAQSELARAEAEAARATSDYNAEAAANAAAETERRAQQLASLSLVSTAQRLMAEGDPDLALSLALAAANIPSPPPEVNQFLNSLTERSGTRASWLADADNERVWQIALSPDGRYLATTSGLIDAGQGRGRVRLWLAESGREVREFRPENSTDEAALVLALAFTPNNEQLITAGLDGIFRLWEVETGALVSSFRMENGERLISYRGGVLAGSVDSLLALSADGKRLLSASEDGILRLRELPSGRVLARLRGHEAPILALAFSGGEAEDMRAFSADSSGRIIVWDALAGEAITAFTAQTGAVDVLLSSADGRYILYNTPNNDLIYADLETNELKLLQGHTDLVTAASISADGLTALSAAADARLILWDLRAGVARGQYLGHSAAVTDVVFLPDGRNAISSDQSGAIRVWDLLGAAGERGRINVSGEAFGVALSSDGRYVAVGTGNRLANEAQLGEFNGLILYEAQSLSELRRFEGHTDEVISVAFSPDGRRLLSTSRDRSLRVWDVASGAELWRLDDHTLPFFRAAFSPDGRFILSGGYRDRPRLINAGTGEILRVFGADDSSDGHGGAVIGVAFNADGSEALSAASDGSLVLWEVESGAILEHLAVDQAVLSLALSPDGLRALVGTVNGLIIELDLRTGAELHQLRGHTGAVWRVAYTPEGEHVLSAGHDGSLIYWHLLREIQRLRYEGLNGAMVDFAFGRGGVIYSSSGALHRWESPRQRPLDGMIAWLRENRYVRPLTCSEQNRFIVAAGLAEGCE